MSEIDSMSDNMKLLATYALLGQMIDKKPEPKAELLLLVPDGWTFRFADGHEVHITVAQAYEASGFDQKVLDATRNTCGYLRTERDTRKGRELLAKLRSELEEARKLKASRQE